MKNNKERKVIKKMIERNLMQNSIPQYQQTNTNADFFQQKEEEGRQYEQQNYRQVSSDIVYLLLLVKKMQKELHKMKKSMRAMSGSMENNNDALQKMEKKLKKQSEEIGKLCKKISLQKTKLKKSYLQIKQLKKIICYVGVGLGINTMSDNLDKILKKCTDNIGSYRIQGKSRKEIIDTSANFFEGGR